MNSQTRNAVLVVIGDIGRSPRMCYHAKSLADKNYSVQVVGYLDSEPHKSIRNDPKIVFLPLYPVPLVIQELKGFARNIAIILKFLWVFFTLLFVLLLQVKRPTLIMMQNPPGVPAMFVCWIVARLYQTKFVIDWHNYTFSMFSQTHCIIDGDPCLNSLPEQNFRSPQLNASSDVEQNHRKEPVNTADMSVSANGKKKASVTVKEGGYIARGIIGGIHCWEGFFGRRADLNFCVTKAMRQHMKSEWGVHSITVYDKPPSWKFGILDNEERHQLFFRFSKAGGVFSSFRPAINDDSELEATRFSFRDTKGIVHLRPDRPLLLISSTSWTEDEDFSYLLHALRDYNNAAQLSLEADPSAHLPCIFCIITGKGPMKSYYVNEIKKVPMQNVAIITHWLEAEDYPLLLGCADIGVSLHTSTSGLDLPMKVLDMFGSGIPVIAKRFPSIDELIIDGCNGCLFNDSMELFKILEALARGFPQKFSQLHFLTENVLKGHKITWEKNWDTFVWPLIRTFGVSSTRENKTY